MKANPMNATANQVDPKQIDALSEDIRHIAETVEGLEEAARLDAAPRLERLRVMERALRRDLVEQDSDLGADAETAAQLYERLLQETHDLKYEMIALGQGNPTTVSAAGDAVMKAVDSVVAGAAGKVDQAKQVLREGVDSVRGKLADGGDSAR